MGLNKLYLKNYRGYGGLNIEFSKNLAIFLGESVQGKTNLLGSIYVLAMARSYRTSSEQELTGQNDNQTMIQGETAKDSSTFPLETLLSKKGRKIKIGHIEQKKLSTYVGQMNVILLVPEGPSLIKDSPQIRRKFLDTELGQINPICLYDLVQYQTILG